MPPSGQRLPRACGYPYSLSGWTFAWWSNARPQGASLRTVLVRDVEELIGVAPFYVEGHRYRLLALPPLRAVQPLAVRGQEEEVAAAIAAELAGLEPRPQTIDFGPTTADYKRRLGDAERTPGPARPPPSWLRLPVSADTAGAAAGRLWLRH
jgi:hypothetical protein